MMVLVAVTHDARLRGQIHPVSRCGEIHHSEEGIGELIIVCRSSAVDFYSP
jgi:hypothetical protein